MELSLRLLSQLPLANTQANDRLASIAVDAMQNLVRL